MSSPHLRPLVDQTPTGALMTSPTLEARCVLPCHRSIAKEVLSLADGLPAGSQQRECDPVAFFQSTVFLQ